ncbi:hypothetical protein D3C78_1742040 [compost metagenome]
MGFVHIKESRQDVDWCPCLLPWSSGDIAQGDLALDALQHLLDGQLRGIQLNRIGRRFERGHCALGVALITRTNLI